MATKRENLQIQIQQAEVKRRAVLENTEQLKAKRSQIDIQIEANNRKVERLNFFLEKTKKTLEG